MKLAILGHNDHSLPRECFVPKEYKDLYQKPFWLKCRGHEENRFTDRMHLDIARNGKVIVLKKPLKYDQGVFECSLSFYSFQNVALSRDAYRKVWFHDYSCDFIVNNSFQYGLMAIYSAGNIVLNGQKIDDEKVSKTDPRNWVDDIDELYTIESQLQEAYDYELSVVMKFSLDDETLCVIIDADEITTAHFFKCVYSSSGNLSLETMLSMNLRDSGIKSVMQVEFNDTGDKIAVSSIPGSFLVYSLREQSVLAFEKIADFDGFYWLSDVKNGEVLVNFYRQVGLICVFSLNYEEGTLNVLREVSVSDLIEDVDFKKCLFTVSSGTSLALLGFNDVVYLIDLSSGLLIQQLKSEVASSRVQDIKLNWCSNEIIVLYGDDASAQYFIQVHPICYGKVESLFNSALKTVFLNHSVNDLLRMNLPKSIKKYFIS